MLSEKYLATVILTFATSAVLAKPSGIALSVVQDKTICRTEVDYDVDMNRIPKVIKVLKCAADPYMQCPASDAGEAPCCGRTPLAGPQFKCIEVLDSVLVSDVNKATYTINVPVGCSCIRQDSNRALELK